MNTRKYWYRKILIMIVTFSMVVGGSYYLIEAEQGKLQREVSAATTDKTMVIPGGMPIGIYLETNGVMVLGTDAIEGIDGEKHNPSEHLVKAGDYITEVNGEAYLPFTEIRIQLRLRQKPFPVKKININWESG